MTNYGRFTIHNDLPGPIGLYIEPEGADLILGADQEVSVTDAFTTVPATLRISTLADGSPAVSIWPGDGAVKVLRDGIDVLDLMQKSPRTILLAAGAKST